MQHKFIFQVFLEGRNAELVKLWQYRSSPDTYAWDTLVATSNKMNLRVDTREPSSIEVELMKGFWNEVILDQNRQKGDPMLWAEQCQKGWELAAKHIAEKADLDTTSDATMIMGAFGKLAERYAAMNKPANAFTVFLQSATGPKKAEKVEMLYAVIGLLKTLADARSIAAIEAIERIEAIIGIKAENATESVLNAINESAVDTGFNYLGTDIFGKQFAAALHADLTSEDIKLGTNIDDAIIEFKAAKLDQAEAAFDKLIGIAISLLDPKEKKKASELKSHQGTVKGQGRNYIFSKASSIAAQVKNFVG